MELRCIPTAGHGGIPISTLDRACILLFLPPPSHSTVGFSFAAVGGVVVTSIRSTPTGSISLAMGTDWDRGLTPIGTWILDADTIGISHITALNSSHFALLEWTDTHNTPFVLMGSFGDGILANISLPQFISAYDIITDGISMAFFYSTNADVTIEGIVPNRQILVQTTLAPTVSFSVVPIGSWLGFAPGGVKTSKSIWFVKGIIIFNTAEIAGDGFSLLTGIKYYRMSDMGVHDICFNCSAVHLEYILATDRYFISGPFAVSPAIGDVAWQSNTNIWNNTVYSISTQNAVVPIGRFETGLVLQTFTPPSADNIIINCFNASTSSSSWMELQSIIFQSTNFTTTVTTLRSSCFADFDVKEMAGMRPAITTNTTSNTNTLWFAAPYTQGRAIIGRYRTGISNVVPISMAPIRFPLVSSEYPQFFPLLPGSMDTIVHFVINNESPVLGLLSTDTGNTVSLADSRVDCMLPMRIQDGIGVGNATTFVQVLTPPLLTSKLYAIEHGSKATTAVTFDSVLYTTAAAAVALPGLVSFNSFGAFAALSNSSHAEIVILGPTGNIVRRIGMVRNQIGGGATLYAHTFASGPVSTLFIYDRVVYYNSNTASFIDLSSPHPLQLATYPAAAPVMWGSGVAFISENRTVYNSSNGQGVSDFYTRHSQGDVPEVCHAAGTLMVCGRTARNSMVTYSTQNSNFSVVDSVTGYVNTWNCVACGVIDLFNDILIVATNVQVVGWNDVRVALVTFKAVDGRTNDTIAGWSQAMLAGWEENLRVFKYSDRMFIGMKNLNLDIVMISYPALQAARKKRSTFSASPIVFVYHPSADPSTVTIEDSIAGPFTIVGPSYQVAFGNPTFGVSTVGGLNITVLPQLPCAVADDCASNLCSPSFFCVSAPVAAPASQQAPALPPASAGAPASGSPSSSTSPSATSGPSSTSSCAGAGPSGASCVGGVWQIVGNVTLPPGGALLIGGPTTITGNLVMLPNSTLNVTLGNPLTVQGCVTFAGTLVVNVPPGYAVQNNQTEVLVNHGGSCSGTPSQFATTNSNFQGQEACKTASAEPQYGQRNLGVLFSSVNDSGCSNSTTGGSAFPWWAILAICGGILLILIIIFIIIAVNRDKIIPYYKSRAAMLKAKQTMANRQSGSL